MSPQAYLREAIDLLGRKGMPGWRLHRFSGKAHPILRHELTGAQITIASTSGDHRSLAAVVTTARRAIAAANGDR
jgi:hypothetical protein